MMIGTLGIILMCGLVLAANGQDVQDTDGIPYDGIVVAGGQQLQQNSSAGERTIIAPQIKDRIKAGNYQVNGNQLSIQEKTNNQIQLKVRNVSVNCDCNLTGEYDPVQNRTKLEAMLSNGRNAEIKIMPDTASATALGKLRLKVCNESRNCSVELKEVGKDNATKRLVYEARAKKTFRIFGFIKNQGEVRTQIDAETGEVVETKRPWWAWMASEKEE